ncbi:MAG TPA: type Z 30S ribosomal protein S14 [Myxococcota bacterium]|nr:type Z 30S ribosomal protein S14 [Myxococcota bacterium]
MARHAQMVRLYAKEKFPTRHRNRCPRCGRSRAYLRRWRLCRICFRSLALSGDIPGVTKASW